jgi:hypothetical protein
VKVESSLGQNFSFVHGGAPRDQLEPPAVRGRTSYVIQTILEAGQFSVLQHACILLE